jgi:hypothetical protein
MVPFSDSVALKLTMTPSSLFSRSPMRAVTSRFSRAAEAATAVDAAAAAAACEDKRMCQMKNLQSESGSFSLLLLCQS